MLASMYVPWAFRGFMMAVFSPSSIRSAVRWTVGSNKRLAGVSGLLLLSVVLLEQLGTFQYVIRIMDQFKGFFWGIIMYLEDLVESGSEWARILSQTLVFAYMWIPPPKILFTILAGLAAMRLLIHLARRSYKSRASSVSPSATPESVSPSSSVASSPENTPRG